MAAEREDQSPFRVGAGDQNLLSLLKCDESLFLFVAPHCDRHSVKRILDDLAGLLCCCHELPGSPATPTQCVLTQTLLILQPVTESKCVTHSNRPQWLTCTKEISHVLHDAVVVQMRATLHICSAFDVRSQKFCQR